MATYSDVAWNAWTTVTSGTTVSSSTSVDTTWYTWNGSTYVQENHPVYGVDVGQPHPAHSPAFEAELQRTYDRIRDATFEREVVFQQQFSGVAERDAKAEQLLLSNLNKTQKKFFLKENRFFVTGQSGRKYSIHKHRNTNVHLLDKDGSTTHRLCVVCSEVPLADQLLAQKLMLEHNESLFLDLAHWFNPEGLAISRPVL